jgi:hypothetical protein
MQKVNDLKMIEEFFTISPSAALKRTYSYKVILSATTATTSTNTTHTLLFCFQERECWLFTATLAKEESWEMLGNQ